MATTRTRARAERFYAGAQIGLDFTHPEFSPIGFTIAIQGGMSVELEWGYTCTGLLECAE